MLTMTTLLQLNNFYKGKLTRMKIQDKTLILVLSLMTIATLFVGLQLYHINDTLKELLEIIANK